MKKIIIAVVIVLTSGIAAFALTNKPADKTAEIKAEKAALQHNVSPVNGVQSDLAVAD